MGARRFRGAPTPWSGPAGSAQPAPCGASKFVSTTMGDRQQLTFVPEFSLAEAARVLSIDRRTVKGLVTSGVLRARVAGLPSSRRPRYRIPQADVLAFRNEYQAASRGARLSGKAAKRIPTDQLKHIHLNS